MAVSDIDHSLQKVHFVVGLSSFYHHYIMHFGHSHSYTGNSPLNLNTKVDRALGTGKIA